MTELVVQGVAAVLTAILTAKLVSRLAEPHMELQASKPKRVLPPARLLR